MWVQHLKNINLDILILYNYSSFPINFKILKIEALNFFLERGVICGICTE